MATLINDEDYQKFLDMKQEELDERNVGKCRWCGDFFIRTHGNEAFCSDTCRRKKNNADKYKHYLKKNGVKPKNKESVYKREVKKEVAFTPELDIMTDDPNKYLYLNRHKNKKIKVPRTIEQKQRDLLETELSKYKFKNKDMIFGDFSIYDQ